MARVKQNTKANYARKVKQSVKQNINQVGQTIPKTTDLATKCGAGDGTRTRDHLLGRQGLYQLSYSRKVISILADNPRLVKGGLLRQEN